MTKSAPGDFEGFGPDLLEFYEGLSADNSKAYWEDHRSIYDTQVGGPAKALAAGLAREFGTVRALRPHRDLRFFKDKTPYKTSVALIGDPDAGGSLYFSASADGVDLGGGIYLPAKDQLGRFRELQDDDTAVRSMDTLLTDLDGTGFSIMERDSLKTAPRGWSSDHPRIEMLRLKHLAVGQRREPGSWLENPACLDEVACAWRQVNRWNLWLAEHLGAGADLEP
ncbi:MAG: DUF2461 domain-containing protein [Allobranchiibius sp.]